MTTSTTATPSMSLCEALAAELRAEAARRRMSQRDLALKMGVSRGWVERRWSGTKQIDADDMEAISNYFGWTVMSYLNRAEILRGTAPTNPPTMAYPTPTLRSRMSDLSLVTTMSRPLSFAPKLGQDPFHRAETTL